MKIIKGKYIGAEITNDMNVEEIKKAVKSCPNGGYAVVVCKNCGMYWTNPEPNPPLKILEKCGMCSEW